MQSTTTSTMSPTASAFPAPLPRKQRPHVNRPSSYQIIRRNGAVVSFEPNKIAVALMKAFWPFTARKARPRPACAKPLTA